MVSVGDAFGIMNNSPSSVEVTDVEIWSLLYMRYLFPILT